MSPRVVKALLAIGISASCAVLAAGLFLAASHDWHPKAPAPAWPLELPPSGATSAPTVMERAVSAVRSPKARPFNGSPEDARFWNEKVRVYECENGTFQVFSCGQVLGSFDTLALAKASKRDWVERLLEAERHPAPLTLPSNQPCGKVVD